MSVALAVSGFSAHILQLRVVSQPLVPRSRPDCPNTTPTLGLYACSTREDRDSQGDRVLGELVNGSPSSVLAGSEALNQCDVALIQHEYGLYGGTDGDEVLEILGALRVPSIVIAHTILTQPDSASAVCSHRRRGFG